MNGRRRDNHRPGARLTVPLFLILAIVVSACGSGAETTTTSAPTTETTASDGAESPSDVEYSLQYTTFVGPNNPTSEGIEWWASEIEERTNGRVQIEFFYQGSLLGGADTIQGLADGRADVAQVGGAFYPDLALSAVVAVPFVTSNADAQMRAFHDLYAQNSDFREEWESRGVVVLAFPPNTPNVIGTTEPVSSLDDLEGLQIRSSGFVSEALAAIGANPVALPSPEIYESVQRGVIDGYSGFTFDYIPDFRLHEVAPVTTDSGLGNYVISPLVISKSLWDEMPEDLRAVLEDVSVEFMDQVIALLTESDERVCQILQDEGGTVAVLPDGEVDRWREAIGTSIYDQWASSVPDGVDADAFFDEYTAILAGYEAETTYEPGIRACAGAAS